jgi:Zn-dependent protease
MPSWLSRLLRILGWSFPLFRLGGIQLAMHWSFLLLPAYAAVAGWWWSEDWVGAATGVALVMVLFTCVVLHELGHCFVARRLGVQVPRILLLPIGGMAEFDRMPRRPAHEFLIANAGPLVNVVLAGVLLAAVGLPADWSFWSLDYPDTGTGALQAILHWNLWMAAFNLTPAFPMDGGRILRAALACFRPYLQATFCAATVGKVVAAALILLALDAELYQLAVLFAFIIVAGELEYRSLRRMEREAAQWREILTRFPEQAGEPPILGIRPLE